MLRNDRQLDNKTARALLNHKWHLYIIKYVPVLDPVKKNILAFLIKMQIEDLQLS